MSSLPQQQDGAALSNIQEQKSDPWWSDLADEYRITHPWFRPLPLLDSQDDATNLKSESVGEWSLACAVFSNAEVKMLTPTIIARGLPVRSIVGLSDRRASIVFSIDAKTREEWAVQCRELRARLENLGVKVSPFRYDWLAHLPSEAYGNKLVYLAPCIHQLDHIRFGDEEATYIVWNQTCKRLSEFIDDQLGYASKIKWQPPAQV